MMPAEPDVVASKSIPAAAKVPSLSDFRPPIGVGPNEVPGKNGGNQEPGRDRFLQRLPRIHDPSGDMEGGVFLRSRHTWQVGLGDFR